MRTEVCYKYKTKYLKNVPVQNFVVRKKHGSDKG